MLVTPCAYLHLTRDHIAHFDSDYHVRVHSTGCYFFGTHLGGWHAKGVKTVNTTYSSTFCRTSHLTSFATGFFTLPNTIDFEYIFARTSFEDNLTIYMAVIFSAVFLSVLMVWAR